MTTEVEKSMPPGFGAHFDLCRAVDVRDDLPGITVPTLVFAAGADRLVLPDSHRSLASGITGAELVELPAAAHILDPTERQVWLARVREFLPRAEQTWSDD